MTKSDKNKYLDLDIITYTLFSFGNPGEPVIFIMHLCGMHL